MVWQLLVLGQVLAVKRAQQRLGLQLQVPEMEQVPELEQVPVSVLLALDWHRQQEQSSPRR